MTCDYQFDLLPRRGDKLWSASHRVEPVARASVYFANGVRTELGEFALFEPAAVPWRSTPDVQQHAANLPSPRLQEFDQMWTVDRAGRDAEIEDPKTAATDNQRLLLVEAVLQGESLAVGSQDLFRSGSLAQSVFVDGDNGAPFATALFFGAGQRLVYHCLIGATPRASTRIPLRGRNSGSLNSRWCRFVGMPASRSLPTSIYAHEKESPVINLRNSQ